MPRDGSGTYNLPPSNPVVSGTVITKAWADGTLTDIAQALTDSQVKANLPTDIGLYLDTNLPILINGYIAELPSGPFAPLDNFIQAGIGAVTWTRQNKERERISALDFGAKGDGVTAGDEVFIQKAMVQAKAMVFDSGGFARPGWGGNPVVDLGGRSYVINNPINFDGLGGIAVCNGKLICNPFAWSGPTVYAVKLGATGGSGSRYIAMERVAIECNHVANGIDINNNTSCNLVDIDIHGMTNYGVREHGASGDNVLTRCRAGQFWFNETPDVNDYTKRTAIGFSDEGGDNRHFACEAFYCLVPVVISGAGSHHWQGGHSFNGTAAPPTWDISAITNNAGSVRVLTPSTAGMVSGMKVSVPWLAGVSGGGAIPVGTTTSKSGVYIANIVDATHFDLPGYIFPAAGAYTGSGQHVTDWDKEPVNILIMNTAQSVVLNGVQVDNGKIQMICGPTPNAAQVSMNNCLVLRSDEGFNTCGVEIVLDQTPNLQAAAISIVGNYFKNAFPPFRFTEIYGGTLLANPFCDIKNNHRSDGLTCPTYGRTVAFDGSEALPGFIFTTAANDENEGDVPQNDVNTGLWHPAEDRVACSTKGVRRWMMDDLGNIVFGKAQLLANATDGFVYIPTIAGPPSAAPTAYANLAPIALEMGATPKLWVRVGAAWKSTNLA
jgi:hypothetical protein